MTISIDQADDDDDQAWGVRGEPFSVEGRDFLVYFWTRAVYRRLPAVDRAIVRAGARERADGSFCLLLAAG